MTNQEQRKLYSIKYYSTYTQYDNDIHREHVTTNLHIAKTWIERFGSDESYNEMVKILSK